MALVGFRASRHTRVSILLLFRRNEAYGDFALSRAVKLNQNYTLPGAEDESAIFRQQGERCSYQSRQDVIRNVLRIVRMPVVELGDDALKRVEHVGISSRIKIGCGQSGSCMQHHQVTSSGMACMLLSKKRFYLIGDIQDLAFVVRFDRKTLHGRDFRHESPV